MPGLEYFKVFRELGKLGTCLSNQAFPDENTGVIIAHLCGSLQGFKSVNCECVI